MTIQELGQKTKAKYPQYQKYSDEEVGKKVLAKYPVYQAQITKGISLPSTTKEPEKTGFFKDLFETTIGKKGLAGIAQMPGKVATAPGLIKEQTGLAESRTGLANMTTELIKKWKETPEGSRKTKLEEIIKDNWRQMGVSQTMEKSLEKETLTPEKAIATTLRAGSFVGGLAMGAPTSALKAAGIGATLGAPMGAANALEEGKDWKEVAKNAFTTGLISAGTGAAFYGAGQLAKKTFTAIAEKSPTAIIKNAARIRKELTTAQKKGIDVVKDKGKWFQLGKLQGDVKNGIKSLNSQIDDILKAGVGQVDDVSMRDIYKTSIGKIESPNYFIESIQSRVPIIERAKVGRLMKKETLNNVEANWLRKLIDFEILPKKYFESGQGAATIKSIGSFNSALRNTVKNNTGTGKLFAEEQGYIEAQKILNKIFQYDTGHWEIGFTDVLTGMVSPGGLATDIPIVATRKAITSPKVKTIAARGIQRLGQVAGRIKIPSATSQVGRGIGRSVYQKLLEEME